MGRKPVLFNIYCFGLGLDLFVHYQWYTAEAQLYCVVNYCYSLMGKRDRSLYPLQIARVKTQFAHSHSNHTRQIPKPSPPSSSWWVDSRSYGGVYGASLSSITLVFFQLSLLLYSSREGFRPQNPAALFPRKTPVGFGFGFFGACARRSDLRLRRRYIGVGAPPPASL